MFSQILAKTQLFMPNNEGDQKNIVEPGFVSARALFVASLTAKMDQAEAILSRKAVESVSVDDLYECISKYLKTGPNGEGSMLRTFLSVPCFATSNFHVFMAYR